MPQIPKIILEGTGEPDCASQKPENMSAQNANPAKAALLKTISNLIDCLVNIKDENSEFLLTLEDGRVIDTKGWNDWEVRPTSPYMRMR